MSRPKAKRFGERLERRKLKQADRGGKTKKQFIAFLDRQRKKKRDRAKAETKVRADNAAT